jgi:type II secretory ATPase GspE/PulE/Tfp pilus assembly ATPase PilB-like protein
VSHSTEEVQFKTDELDVLEAADSVVRLLSYASELRASDLFLNIDENDATVSIRHMGTVKQVCVLTRDECARFQNHIRAVAGMPAAQKQRPADGRWVCNLDDDKKLDLRISVIPTIWGDDMSIRLLECDQGLLDLENLGFHPRNLEALIALLSTPAGLVLVTGPTGAGKTTTLYACLNYLNDGTRKINTLEDPVEYDLPRVRQTEIHAKVGLDFPDLLPSVLRQAPDVIMIGEIRDPITAETAVRAANSGHLVLATAHAPVAAAAINSMLALGVNPRFLGASLRGAVSQRLLRQLCEHCKTGYDVSGSPETFEDVRRWLAPGEGDQIYASEGCEHCDFEGVSGRTGVLEVLQVSQHLRQMIHERRSTVDLRRAAVAEGMLDLRRSALLKVAQGITSTEEVIRTIPSEHLLPDD